MKQPFVALYRILGNDLPPRHERGHVYENLKFILEHEPHFPNCLKKWIVNRVVYSRMEQKIIDFLERHKQPYLRIPFDLREYNACQKKRITDEEAVKKLSIEAERERHKKILYVTNINNARNRALEDGRGITDWILPCDGNSCFTQEGWDAMVRVLSTQTGTDRWFAVPMYRLLDNRHYINFDLARYKEQEPQLVFGKECDQTFNESYRYGDLDKAEFLMRSGITIKDKGYGLIVLDQSYRCGYVARLFSGVEAGEDTWYDRAPLREKGLDILLNRLDRCRSHQSLDRRFDIEYALCTALLPLQFLLRPLRRTVRRLFNLLKESVKRRVYEGK